MVLLDPTTMTVTVTPPNRAILPLPRRPLRDRLPPGLAATIEYPPSATPRVFSYLPDTPPRDESSHRTFTDPSRLGSGRNAHASRSPPPEIPIQTRLFSTRDDNRLPTPQSSVSPASSGDDHDHDMSGGNNKKRKTPGTGDTTHHNAMGESKPPLSAGTPSATSMYRSADGSSLVGPYTSMGISGSGRGTLGARSRLARPPLSDIQGNANWGYRSAGSRLGPGQTTSDKKPAGIISSAIADAEKNASPRPQMTSDFSFRCESKVPDGSPLVPDVSRIASSSNVASPNNIQKEHTGQNAAPAPDPAEVERQNRRRLSREYAQAARSRRQRQHMANIQNSPKPDDMWICFFCEYEAIFKEPPRGLIRQYEMRDRKVRDQEAERRRLLEKAKIKRKKAKKASKNTPQTGGTQQPPGHPSDPHHSGASAETHLPPEDIDGWDGQHHDHGHGHSGHHEEPESDAADIDSDEGPPDLFREYAHPVVSVQMTNGPLG